jgi:hypothetical protein
MAEFTGSPMVSPFPNQNILFNSASGLTGQELQKNQLAIQGQQMDLTAADHEQVGRLAAGLLAEPDLGRRADLYARGVGMLQAQNLAKYAPPTLPDESTLRSLVSQTIPAQTQAEWLQNLTANKAYTNAGNTASTAAPGSTTGAAPPTTTPPGSGATIGQRQNNPGNLTFAGQPGAQPGQGNRFASFPDMPTGVAATADQLAIYQQQHGINTVRGAVTRWVSDPKADLTSYISDISKALGVGPDDKIDLTDPGVQAKFIQAQFPHESAGGGYVLNPADVAKGVQMAAANRGRAVQAPGTAIAATAQPAATPPPTQYAGPGAPGAPTLPPAATEAPPGPAQPPGATAAPAQPGQPQQQPAPAAAQPQVSPAGGPPPPQTPVLNANGLTDLQQRQINAIAANPQTKQGAVVAAQQAFVTQNIQQRQQAFADYMQTQQLAVSQGTLSNAQAQTNLKYWQAAHPELAPDARVNTVAFRTLQELAPIVRQGNAPQDVIDRYNNAATEYQQYKDVIDPLTKSIKSVPTVPLPPGFPQPTAGPGGGGQTGGVQTLTPGASLGQQAAEEQFGKDFATTDKKSYDAANASLGMLVNANNAAVVMNQTPGSFTATGTGANARLELGKTLNTVSGLFGGQPLVDPSKISAWEALNKQTRLMGMQVVNNYFGGSREAASIINGATTAVPNSENSYLGFRLVSSGIEQDLLRQRELYEYKAQRVAAGQPLATAEADFNKANPVQNYTARAIANAVPDNIASHLVANPDTVRAFDQHFGPGIGEFILSGGRTKMGAAGVPSNG